VCTVCDQDCEATFVCTSCHRRKLVCTCQVGGFGDKRRVCASCHFHEATGLSLRGLMCRDKLDKEVG